MQPPRLIFASGQPTGRPVGRVKDTAPTTPAPALGIFSGRILLDKYVAERIVGSGGYAHVYRGVDIDTGEEVAIKTMQPDLCSNAAMRRKFLREMHMTASIKGTHNVKVLGTGEYFGDPFMVLEFLNGVRLRESIHTGFAALHARRLLMQLCHGIKMAHTKGIAHLDIKPENVIVVDGSAGPVAKLFDFGISRPFGTSLDLIEGTPLFMTPEHVSGAPVSRQTDVYATGVVMFTLLCGTEPFSEDASNAQLVMQMHHSSDAPTLSEMRPDIRFHPDIEAIVRTAMQKDPGKRFSNMMEMAGAIARADGWNEFASSAPNSS